ncbi:MAG: hypothetical protein ABIN25_12340 [Ginsengibacter sp.]
MDTKSSFNGYVIRGILANNQFGIIEVNNIENIHSRFFERDEYDTIEKLIVDADIEAIRSMVPNQNKSDEYLEVVIFFSQDNKKYIATVYDSLDLWQNPQLIEIYPL